MAVRNMEYLVAVHNSEYLVAVRNREYLVAVRSRGDLQALINTALKFLTQSEEETWTR